MPQFFIGIKKCGSMVDAQLRVESAVKPKTHKAQSGVDEGWRKSRPFFHHWSIRGPDVAQKLFQATYYQTKIQ
jgi:hypothetical protein